MIEKYVCSICAKGKNWKEFKGLTRRQLLNRKTGKEWIEIPNLIRVNAGHACRDCEELDSVRYAIGMYRRMSTRNQTYFGRPTKITLSEFWKFIKDTDYEALLAAYRAAKPQDRGMLRVCVDRINAWAEYEIGNIQVITSRQNCSKGVQPALGARHLTMKFFKKLRDEQGLTKYEMAQFLGMLPSTYYYYEDQAKGCSFEILCLIRRKLEISWERLGAMIEEEFGKAYDYEPQTILKRRKKTKK